MNEEDRGTQQPGEEHKGEASSGRDRVRGDVATQDRRCAMNKQPLPEFMAPTTEDYGVSIDDFHAYMPLHSYIFTPSREMWPAASINARIPPIEEPGNDKPIAASTWLDKNKPVEQMTWAPGKPMLIKNRLIADGGWIDRHGVSCFNLYKPPIAKPGNPTQAGIWFNHVNHVYPNDAGHIVNWLAQRVQRPEEKINMLSCLAVSRASEKIPFSTQ